MQFPINQPVADAPDVDHQPVVTVGTQLPAQPVSVKSSVRVCPNVCRPQMLRISSARVKSAFGSPRPSERVRLLAPSTTNDSALISAGTTTGSVNAVLSGIFLN